MQRKHKILGILFVALALALWTGPARAADSTWTNTASSTFNDANSWDNGEPTTTNDVATFDSGASYTVTFDATKSNKQAVVVLGGQNVTWDLNGNLYYLRGDSSPGYGNGLFITNAADSGTLTVMNGSLITPYAYGGGFIAGANVDVVITNGGYVSGPANTSIQIGKTLTVADSSSTVYVFDQFDISNVVVRGGSTGNFLRSGYIRNATITDGSLVSGWAALVGGYLTVGTINLTNGGVYTASFTPHGPSSVLIAQDDGYGWVNIGGGTGTSMLESTSLFLNRPNNASGSAHINLFSNGVVRITGNAHPVNATSGATTDFRVSDGQAVTMMGGSVQMTNGAWMTVADWGSFAAPGILRGYGSISNYNTGAKISIVNDGWIRPGDTGTNWNHNIAGLGAINIAGGDLYQTNPLSLKRSGMYFEFSDLALDQINVSGGSATITGGSNVFALASGAAPLGPYKWGLGTYDFITASNITWSPEYANLTSVLAAAGLVQNLDYRFGIVDLGAYQALRLEFVPEPSTVILLLGGGLLLYRFRRRA